jgi:hypothetical protein
MRALLGVLIVLGACGGPIQQVNHSPKRFKEGAPCRGSLHSVFDQVKRSQSMMCRSDQDCALVTSPATPVEEYRLVVHRRDAERVDRLAREHLQRCGAFTHHEPINAVRVVQARCVNDRCVEHVNVLHMDD